MTPLENGMLVQHASLGAGRIVALDATAVHVFFAASETRFATKLRLPMALSFLAPCATPDARLAELPAFVLDPRTGRYGRPAAAAARPAKAKAKPRLRVVKPPAGAAPPAAEDAPPAAAEDAPAKDPAADPAPEDPAGG